MYLFFVTVDFEWNDPLDSYIKHLSFVHLTSLITSMWLPCISLSPVIIGHSAVTFSWLDLALMDLHQLQLLLKKSVS